MSVRRVTVFGSSSITHDSDEYEQARRLGRLLAEMGYEVVNGGQKGSMDAVARGVSEAGGRCIGITSKARRGANRPRGLRRSSATTIS